MSSLDQLSGLRTGVKRTDSTFSYATSMASRYSNDPHAVLLSPPPEVDITVAAHASDVMWPMNMGTRQQIELAKARSATVSALRGMRKLESEINALKGRLQDIERLRASGAVGVASAEDDGGDEEIPDEADSTVSIIQPTQGCNGDEGSSKRFFDRAIEQTLESAKQEGASNRFMMGPPEGQDITLEMANRALANGCKQRDEEITKLKAELERVTNELNELRTKERMQRSDKEVAKGDDDGDMMKSNGDTKDWKTVVRSTAGDGGQQEEMASSSQTNKVERKWYEKLLCFSSDATPPVDVESAPTRSSPPPVLSARTEATTAPHSP
ncbi:hypothetical protein Pmar_PMAR012446 [Perkinsus marinus ATCC 50983]|uniref:Uncharacterized protein n=1 Tax=Perkinsus marinus (strain ATCC 50983 / TXsc) TaxID=423536 RepID=C5K7D0_PERM5|nr:hypothetical protein Pmar_PMAR012446 [Perkinsus marinus ATCC 50983]EER19465.1 hypothetical protein Pmar_PMAR012446 [Perkinsus marinus ATCC 50983]|eukprot:XP_002787669.1 hypothetical protein Pmar_PMAR012446 [Perkinsus marinus ATCC 50983]